MIHLFIVVQVSLISIQLPTKLKPMSSRHMSQDMQENNGKKQIKITHVYEVKVF